MRVVICTLIFIYIYNYYQCSRVYKNKIIIESNKVIKGIKVAHITDFHCNKKINLCKFKKDLIDFSPDIIILTGDFINRSTFNFEYVEKFLKCISQATNKIYFVTGNHEYENEKNKEFFNLLSRLEIVFFESQSSKHLELNNINLVGLNYGMENILEKIVVDKEKFNLFMCHSYNRVKNMKEIELADLILCGHTHGGQIRLPIIGQILGHGFELFPNYSKGLYSFGNRLLSIDSGIGNSSVNLRLFNRVQYSEIVIKGPKRN